MEPIGLKSFSAFQPSGSAGTDRGTTVADAMIAVDCWCCGCKKGGNRFQTWGNSRLFSEQQQWASRGNHWCRLELRMNKKHYDIAKTSKTRRTLQQSLAYADRFDHYILGSILFAVWLGKYGHFSEAGIISSSIIGFALGCGLAGEVSHAGFLPPPSTGIRLSRVTRYSPAPHHLPHPEHLPTTRPNQTRTTPC